MTKYGFVIDQRKCIGCHACTVACKMENDVPLGVYRTWVKYIEKGEFPNTRRYFTVERCQHCEDAPCVAICPTVALFKRTDGIVDFDPDRCIGCKSCMQACPYDALYIDPRSHTAAKCHYCAHRTDRGLLPACVIVCPTKAIVAGDLDDPTSEIARLVTREQVQIRRPEQGTRPQVFYLGADEAAMTPGLAVQPPQYLWAEVGPRDVDLEPKGVPLELVDSAEPSWVPEARPRPAAEALGVVAQPLPELKVLPGQSRGLEPMLAPATKARTVYDVAHPKPWGWKVSTYLWTKSIAAGVLGLAALALGRGGGGPLVTHVAPALALLFIAITGGLLVWDLKRPERFWRVLLTPNPRSWLVLGAYIITLFGGVAVLWLLTALAGLTGTLTVLAWLGLVLAVAAAGYSAFLFGQAEGRDFWQSPLLLWHLLAAAAAAGAAALLLSGVALGATLDTLRGLGLALAGGLGLALF
ncbi:MAG TPA: 4Fe-4S dicluster domain-containing protein, partial [Chloroflexota bacterium]